MNKFVQMIMEETFKHPVNLPKGESYRLCYKHEMINGTTVQLNGKHDKYGYVMSPIRKDDMGYWYNVRGTGDKKKDPQKKAKEIPKDVHGKG